MRLTLEQRFQKNKYLYKSIKSQVQVRFTNSLLADDFFFFIVEVYELLREDYKILNFETIIFYNGVVKNGFLFYLNNRIRF